MDNYEKNLFLQAVELHDKTNELLHRIVGYIDAKADLKPDLRFVDGPTILTFPTKKSDVGTSDEAKQGFVNFTEQELKQMPKKIQRLILINKKRCRLETRKSGENTTTYQIRYRSDGYNISACGKTIELAKANFIKKLKTAKQNNQITQDAPPTTFHSFSMFYFETKRIRIVANETYTKDLSRYHKYLGPYFNETPLSKITLSKCQKLIDDVTSEKKFKTAEELHSLMNAIFNFAIDNHLITQNPCTAIIRESYEKETSVALTKDEEHELFLQMHVEPLFELAFALALYTGLRPNELKTARIDGDFIIAVNSKRKRKGKTTERVVEYKRIYICNRLRFYLVDGLPNLPSPQLLRRRIKKALPNHILKDLRKTFNTRCKELGVSEHARKHFMGHSLGTLDNTYTSLSAEYLLKEGKKLNKW